MRFCPSAFEKIKENVSILDVAKRYGVGILHNNKASCPFHKEKTPSCVFYPKTDSFYCFSCNIGGDQITLVKKLFNLNYDLEAAKKINEDFTLNIFEEKLSKKRKEEIKKEFEQREKHQFNISLFYSWKKSTEKWFISAYKSLIKMAEIQKTPSDNGFAIYAFAKAELQSGDLENILDFLCSAADEEVLSKYKYIVCYKENLKNRFEKTRKIIDKGE